MCGRNGPGEFQQRADQAGEDPVALRPVPAAHGAFVGWLQLEALCLGGGILRGQTERRDESRLCLALPGATVAEDPVEDVADAHALRSGIPRPQPATSRILGVATQPQNHLTKPVNRKLKNEVYNTENFSAFYVRRLRASCILPSHFDTLATEALLELP